MRQALKLEKPAQKALSTELLLPGNSSNSPSHHHRAEQVPANFKYRPVAAY